MGLFSGVCVCVEGWGSGGVGRGAYHWNFTVCLIRINDLNILPSEVEHTINFQFCEWWVHGKLQAIILILLWFH